MGNTKDVIHVNEKVKDTFFKTIYISEERRKFDTRLDSCQIIKAL